MAEKVPGPPIIDPSIKGLKRWQLERQLADNYYNRGSRYPPFSIEPLPYSVQRTSRKMTDEERFLRRQWLKDQILAPDEPLGEARPYNAIRRLYRAPWDAIEKSLRGVMGVEHAKYFRVFIPKIFLVYGALLFGYYQLRFHPNTWETATGVQLTGTRRPDLPTDVEHRYADGRFSERTFRNP